MARGSCSVCHATYPGGERFCPVDGGAIVDDDQTDPLIGKTIDGRYLVRRLIGRGGMGAVYEADHVGLDKRVAIKFMIEVDRDALARFRREARAASRITDDHVVQIFDVGTAEGREFIAMEYLDGRDLRTIMQDGPLPPARATSIATQILHGLHAIHEAGIVHRDIKPGNILLAGDTDFVKIMDFGISTMDSVHGESVTRTGQVVGTPQFMAPEQLAGEPIDRRADLYAVGITLYAMLTGDVPFAGTSVAQIASQQLNGPSPTIDARFGISDRVAAAVARALARSPSDRFATALEFAAALGEVVSSRDAQASHATVSERPRSRTSVPPPATRRSWWRWLTLGVVLVATAVVAIVLAMPKHEATRLADAAVVKDDPLAAAQAAERDGKLELAVARYIQLYDGHDDPETLFKIGELYERMDRAPDAVLYFRRYLERSPAAKDHDAVVARIARLSPPPVDASVGDGGAIDAQAIVHAPRVAGDHPTPRNDRPQPAPLDLEVDRPHTPPTPTNPAPTSPACACIPDRDGYRSYYLCATKFTPLCRCQDSSRDAMCPASWQNCPSPCNGYRVDLNGILYSCPKRGFDLFRIKAKPGEPCRGYSMADLPTTFTDKLTLPERDGTYACDFCTAVAGDDDQRSKNFDYAGKTGNACTGIFMMDGEVLAGHLDCEPKKTR